MSNLLTQNKEVSISSLEIAEITQKRHSDVKRDINVVLSELGDVSKFARIYLDSQNREQTFFDLPKREALILVSGYNVKLRAMIIDRLDELERTLKQNIISLPDFSNPAEGARAWAEQYEANLIAQKTIEEQKPLVSYAKSVEASVNSILVREWAKSISHEGFTTGEKRAYKWLREKKYLNAKNEPYQNYVDMGIFEVTNYTHSNHSGTYTRPTTRVTAKGQIYLTEKIIKDLHND